MENLQLELDFNQEEWRLIKGYEGLYQVSSYGRVSGMGRVLCDGRLWKGRVLKQKTNTDGYNQVTLCKDGKEKQYLVHRLVAQAFIPNPNNYPIINHKDENPSNNRVENLEWCTVDYNINYGTCNERKRKSLTNNPKKSKIVLQFTLDGKFIKEYLSVRGAERQTGYGQGNISAVCRGELNQAYGYKWKYKDES